MTARKELVWSLKKALLRLSADQILEIAKEIPTSLQGEPVKFDELDEEDCFDYVCSFMSSTSLLESEDEGMSHLLMLDDIIQKMMRGYSDRVETVEGGAAGTMAHSQPKSTNTLTGTLPSDLFHSGHSISTPSPTGDHVDDYQSTSTHTTKPVHPAVEQPPSNRGESLVTLRDLALFHRKEFKVHGGQIGDSTTDISYSNICKQIDEGLKEQHTQSEVIRAVMRVIKPGHFKDMLVNKDEMTITELKSFLRSHMGEKGTTELFQELITARQLENETPQQFLYRMVGLKQRVIVTSRQADVEIKYEAHTVQNVFLHTIYQGLSDRHDDIRRELKPLISDSSVTDEAILRQVIKTTSEESERRRRLGRTTRTKTIYAQSGEVSSEKPGDSKEDSHRKGKDEEVQKLTTQVQALTQMVESLKQLKLQSDTQTQDTSQQSCHCASANTKRPPQSKGRAYGCASCVEQNLPNCHHCFACGEEGHRAVGCLKRRKPAGNQQWSQPRGDL